MARTIGPHERNLAAMRRANETLCLVYVRDSGPATVSDVVKSTGLSRPTVEAVVGELESQGILSLSDPSDLHRQRAGRPAKEYAFQGTVGYLAGVEITRSAVLVAIADLAGHVQARHVEALSEADRGPDLVSVIRRALDTAAGKLKLERSDLVAAGIGVPGAVGSDGRIVASSSLDSWVDVDLVARLGAAAGCPVLVDSSVNLAMLAEQHMGAARLHDDVILVSGDSELSAALLIGGRLHRGRSSRAGDLGLLDAGKTLADGKEVARAFERAAGGYPDGVIEVGRFASYFAGAIAGLLRSLDPALLVLGGELSDFGSLLSGEIREHLVAELAPRTPPLVVSSSFGADAATYGGLVLAYSLASEEVFGVEIPPPIMTWSQGAINEEAASAQHSHTLDVRPERHTVAVSSDSRRRLRIAVVGVGARAGVAQWAHGAEFDARVVCVADPTEEGRARGRALFGEKVQCFDDHRAMLKARPSLDAAFVTTPDYTHAEVAMDLLRAGIPVYLEKPFATTIEDADAILQAAYDSGTRLYVGHNMRHMAVVKLMRDIINRGEIGEVKAIWCRHFVGHGGDFYFKDWHADRTKTTGLLVHKGAHDLDVIQWLGGAAAAEVTAMGGLELFGSLDARNNEPQQIDPSGDLLTWPPETHRDLNPIIDVEDTSMVSMRLSNGVLCSYEQCHYTPDYWRNYTVIGSRGRLENFGDGQGGVVRVWNRRHAYDADGDLVYRIEGDAWGHDDADHHAVGEFLQFVRDGRPTSTSPVAARDAAVTGIVATESLRNGSLPMRVPGVPRPLVEYFAAGQARPKDRSEIAGGTPSARPVG